MVLTLSIVSSTLGAGRSAVNMTSSPEAGMSPAFRQITQNNQVNKNGGSKQHGPTTFLCENMNR